MNKSIETKGQERDCITHGGGVVGSNKQIVFINKSINVIAFLLLLYFNSFSMNLWEIVLLSLVFCLLCLLVSFILSINTRNKNCHTFMWEERARERETENLFDGIIIVVGHTYFVSKCVCGWVNLTLSFFMSVVEGVCVLNPN